MVQEVLNISVAGVVAAHGVPRGLLYQRGVLVIIRPDVLWVADRDREAAEMQVRILGSNLAGGFDGPVVRAEEDAVPIYAQVGNNADVVVGRKNLPVRSTRIVRLVPL